MRSSISLKHALEITGCKDKDVPVMIATGSTIKSKKKMFMSVSEILGPADWMGQAAVTKILPANNRDKSEYGCEFCFVVDQSTLQPTGHHAYMFTRYGEERTEKNILDIIKFAIQDTK